MNFLIGLLAFLIMLNLIVIIHEGGHFLAARACGVYCKEFSIGMGPAIYSRPGKQTTFSIRALPIGGYVMMAGEEDGSQDEDDEESWLAAVPEDQRLNKKPVWQQIIIMGAGVFMNLVLAVLLMIGLCAWRGYVPVEAKPIVYDIVENSPAQKAGLIPEDTIVKITAADGSSITPKTQLEVTEFIQFNHDELTLDVLRDGETVQMKLTPEYLPEDQVWQMGMISQAGIQPINFWQAIPAGIEQTWSMTASMFRTIGMLFQGKGLDNLSGPIGIYKVTDEVVSMGFASYIMLLAMVSLNIGIFNLLPIPALDGGRIVLLTLESIFRRKIPQAWVEGIMVGSFLLLIGIMFWATWNDITRLFI